MSSAFINSLGSSFGSLTTTQTKSQSRTKKKTTQSGKIVVKKNMTATGVSDPHGKMPNPRHRLPALSVPHAPMPTP